jgi:DNA-binding transcriptional regulator LsrR (DeoR family)
MRGKIAHKISHVAVVKLPVLEEASTTYIDVPVIRTELVAALAARAIVGAKIAHSFVGVSYGYSLERFAFNAYPDTLTKTNQWVPMQTFLAPDYVGLPRASNAIATLFASSFPGSKALYLPYIPNDNGLRELIASGRDLQNWQEKVARNTLNTLRNTRIFIMSAAGYDYLADTNANPLTPADGQKDSFPPLDELCRAVLNDEAEREQFAGALLGYLVRKDGSRAGEESLQTENDRVTYGFKLDELQRRVRQGAQAWLIAAGDHKKDIVLMALDNGYCNNIVIDSEIAKYIVQQHEEYLND